MSPRLVALKAKLQAAHEAIDAQVLKEYPLGTRVTVENYNKPARDVTGPVIGHGKSAYYNGASIVITNERTGKARTFSVGAEFIYKEGAH